jgi:hypothetical protein
MGSNDMEARRNVGYMSQAFSLYGELTVRQNLELHAQLYHLPPGEIPGRIKELLERYDLKAVAVDYLGGVVVGRLGGRGEGQVWLPLDKWATLDEQTLCHKLKVFVFLPPDWSQKRRDCL